MGPRGVRQYLTAVSKVTELAMDRSVFSIIMISTCTQCLIFWHSNWASNITWQLDYINDFYVQGRNTLQVSICLLIRIVFGFLWWVNNIRYYLLHIVFNIAVRNKARRQTCPVFFSDLIKKYTWVHGNVSYKHGTEHHPAKV